MEEHANPIENWTQYEGIADNLENEEDLTMDQSGLDQERLTAEEREEQIIKTLNANDPQAAHNFAIFTIKERIYYKIEESYLLEVLSGRNIEVTERDAWIIASLEVSKAARAREALEDIELQVPKAKFIEQKRADEASSHEEEMERLRAEQHAREIEREKQEALAAEV